MNMKQHEIRRSWTDLRRSGLEDWEDFRPVYLGKSFQPERLRRFVVIDTETTGLSCTEDEIIQLSAVRFQNGQAMEYFDTYLKPGKPIPPEAQEINGISEDMVKDAPVLEEVAEAFLAFVGNDPIVLYNAKFDLMFLWCAGIDLVRGREIYDAMYSSYGIFSKKALPNRRLVTVANALNIVFDAHNSLEDSRATGEVMLEIVKRLTGRYGINVPEKIPMTREDIEKQMAMNYDDQVAYLLKKYWPAEGDYFLDDTLYIKNKEITRTSEGLECHHIDENIIPTLSDVSVAKQHSFDYQRKDRLVYCNLMEHLLLHIKIGRSRFYENHADMRVDQDLKELITHGVNMLSMDCNDLFMHQGSDIIWRQNCYEVIQDSYEEYIEMLRDFQRYIVEEIRLSEFEKPLYRGRSFTDEETGERAVITEITDEQVIAETDTERWIYSREDFAENEELNRKLEEIRRILSSIEEESVPEIREAVSLLDVRS